MADQTPDPWQVVDSSRRFIEVTGNKCVYYDRRDVDRARTLTDEQHQREIDRLEQANAIIREEGVEARAVIMSRDIEIVKLRKEIAAKDETIRQAKDWTQHNFDEAVKHCQRAEAAEARCATLTAALAPFGDVYLAMLEEAHDALQVGGYVPTDDDAGTDDRVTVGMCRMAHAALAAAPQGGSTHT